MIANKFHLSKADQGDFDQIMYAAGMDCGQISTIQKFDDVVRGLALNIAVTEDIAKKIIMKFAKRKMLTVSKSVQTNKEDNQFLFFRYELAIAWRRRKKK